MADQDHNGRLRGPPVTASLDLDFRPALNRLLSAVGNLDSGVAAKEPGACHDGRGRERDQGHRSAEPSQHAASLAGHGRSGKEHGSMPHHGTVPDPDRDLRRVSGFRQVAPDNPSDASRPDSQVRPGASAPGRRSVRPCVQQLDANSKSLWDGTCRQGHHQRGNQCRSREGAHSPRASAFSCAWLQRSRG